MPMITCGNNKYIAVSGDVYSKVTGIDTYNSRGRTQTRTVTYSNADDSVNSTTINFDLNADFYIYKHVNLYDLEDDFINYYKDFVRTINKSHEIEVKKIDLNSNKIKIKTKLYSNLKSKLLYKKCIKQKF